MLVHSSGELVGITVFKRADTPLRTSLSKVGSSPLSIIGSNTFQSPPSSPIKRTLGQSEQVSNEEIGSAPPVDPTAADGRLRVESRPMRPTTESVMAPNTESLLARPGKRSFSLVRPHNKMTIRPTTRKVQMVPSSVRGVGFTVVR